MSHLADYNHLTILRQLTGTKLYLSHMTQRAIQTPNIVIHQVKEF